MKYTGPPKPIPTERIHPVDNRWSRAIFLSALIAVLLADLLIWRPG